MEFLLGLPQSLLSRHLAYLRSAGLAVDRRIGVRVQYSVAAGPELIEHIKACLESFLGCEEIYRRDRWRLEQWRQAGGVEPKDSGWPFSAEGAKS